MPLGGALLGKGLHFPFLRMLAVQTAHPVNQEGAGWRAGQ